MLETLREQLANELFRYRCGARRGGESFGRSVDGAVIWFLFAQMCEQRQVSPPTTTLTAGFEAEREFLADVFSNFWKANEPSFPSLLPIEILGTVYENLLRQTIAVTRSGPRSHASSVARKDGGVYYTPRYVVDYIVDETVGKLIAGKSPREMREVRILDPACGTGRFLFRVYDRLVGEHLRWFEAHPRGAKADIRLSQQLKREILSNCIFGVDIDELAVEVTKLSLYLKLMEDKPSRIPEQQGDSMAIVAANIQCGDSLVRSRSGGFDVVLGNPPYGAELSAAMRARLSKEFEAGTTETAALMMLHASRNLTRPGGLNGFIVPKAFTYSSNWRKVRKELLDEMKCLVDVGKVWPAVRLEQVIYFLRKGTPTESYTNLKRDGERFEKVARIDKQHCRGFEFLLNGIPREELAAGLKIQNAGSFLSDYVSNTRGAMFQNLVTSRSHGRRVIGGKQIQRFQISGEKGFIPSSTLLDKNAFVVPESILVQNIIAHIENPVDHIKITAAVVEKDLASKIVILDTVNQLANRSKLSSYFFLAILNSRVMNWYVYRFIYAKAIRTMHFDGPVTSRIPIPRITAVNQNLYEEIVRRVKVMSGESLEMSQAIESALYRLYGLSRSDVAVIESGMPSGMR